jgi:CheY-like chemotaxis protein
MTTILIADTSKPSLVMTSEVFKDKVQGVIVLVAKTGSEAVQLAKTHNPDMCVVDFDLPDVDGVTLVSALREFYKGPVLLTAYPDDVVKNAVTDNLFAFNDAGGWLAKPIKVEDLNQKIEKFLLEKQRVAKRFPSTLEMFMQLIGKGAGRGKRAPKVNGRVVNLSYGGACIELDKPLTIKSSEELTLAFSLPDSVATMQKAKAKLMAAMEKARKAAAKAKPVKAVKGKKGAKGKAVVAPVKAKPTPVIVGSSQKIKARICWTKKGGQLAGLQFSKLTPAQKKGLEILLKDMAFDDTTV